MVLIISLVMVIPVLANYKLVIVSYTIINTTVSCVFSGSLRSGSTTLVTR